MLIDVNEYATMHYFGIPAQTQSIITYKIRTIFFPGLFFYYKE